MIDQPTHLTTPEAREPRSFMRRYGQRLLVLIFWLLVVVMLQWYRTRHGLSTFEIAQRLLTFFSTSPYGPLLYITVYAVRPLLFFSAVLLTLGGGFVFGPIAGVIYTVIGSNISASVAYVVGRFLGKGLVASEEGSGLLRRWAARMREEPFTTILTMRCLYVPYDLVNYTAGLLRLRWLPFALASLLGSLPGTLLFVLTGASLHQFTGDVPSFNPWLLVASAALFVSNIALSRLFKRRQAGPDVSLDPEA